MRPFVLLLLAAVLAAADKPVPVAAPSSSPSSVADAISMLGRLPDPLVEKQLDDFFNGASSDDAGRVLMHIAIAAIRPARVVVVPMLSRRDPLVVDRALRALSVISVDSTALREQVDRILGDGPPAVAIQAATCLGAGDDLRAVPALVARMSKGPPEVAGAALVALQRLTHVDFKNDAVAWDAWYQAYRMEAVPRLSAQADLLAQPENKKQIAGLHALANMRGDRLEAIDLVLPMLKAEEPAVVMAARQALGTLAPRDYVMPTNAEVIAATLPPAPVVAAKGGVITYLANQGMFDTWYGLLLTTFTGILVLSGVLFVLRSGPVKNATRRFGRVVAAGTMRLARPVMQVSERIQRGTQRIIRSFGPGATINAQVKAAGSVTGGKGELSSKSRQALDAEKINHLKKNRIGGTPTPPGGNGTPS